MSAIIGAFNVVLDCFLHGACQVAGAMSSTTSALNILVPVGSASLLAVDRSGCLVFTCAAALVLVPGACGLALLAQSERSAGAAAAERARVSDGAREDPDVAASDSLLSEPLMAPRAGGSRSSKETSTSVQSEA